MNHVNILKTLVELNEQGNKPPIEDFLAGISREELIAIAQTFEKLAAYASDVHGSAHDGAE